MNCPVLSSAFGVSFFKRMHVFTSTHTRPSKRSTHHSLEWSCWCVGSFRNSRQTASGSPVYGGVPTIGSIWMKKPEPTRKISLIEQSNTESGGCSIEYHE